MRLRLALLFTVVFLSAAAGIASGQQSYYALKGQLFLPNGDMPTEPIRFEIENDLGFHDTEYTDSNGRFLLDGIVVGTTYHITIPSDGANWGETRYQFVTDSSTPMDPRITLNKFKGEKPAKPGVISAPGAYTPDAKVKDLQEKGMKAFKAGKADEAESLLRQATEADPKYAAAFYDLGTVLMHEGKVAEAEAAYQKGTLADPKSVSLFLAYGLVLVREHKYADAIPPLRETLRLKPDQPDAQLQLGASLVETNQLDDAETQLLAVQKIKGDTDAGLEFYLGKLYYLKKEYQKSIDALTAYLKLVPENSPNAAPVKNLIQGMKDELAKKSGS